LGFPDSKIRRLAQVGAVIGNEPCHGLTRGWELLLSLAFPKAQARILPARVQQLLVLKEQQASEPEQQNG
jgi:hypothetical protein